MESENRVLVRHHRHLVIDRIRYFLAGINDSLRHWCVLGFGAVHSPFVAATELEDK